MLGPPPREAHLIVPKQSNQKLRTALLKDRPVLDPATESVVRLSGGAQTTVLFNPPQAIPTNCQGWCRGSPIPSFLSMALCIWEISCHYCASASVLKSLGFL